MKQHQVYKNQTFSLPIEVTHELHSLVKRREMSRFVAEAIRKELEAKKQELRNAYLSANNDSGQNEATREWEETLMDGFDEW